MDQDFLNTGAILSFQVQLSAQIVQSDIIHQSSKIFHSFSNHIKRSRGVTVQTYWVQISKFINLSLQYMTLIGNDNTYFEKVIKSLPWPTSLVQKLSNLK